MSPAPDQAGAGRGELAAARRESRALMAFAALCSLAVNLLMLTGPLYMLQVYDRVIASRSEETLVALSLLVAGLFLCMGLLDHVRTRLLGLVGARFQHRLDARVFAAAVERLAVAPRDPRALAAQRDLEAVHRLLASPAVTALFDLPFAPLFIAAVFLFHPLLGWAALAGALVLVAMTALNQRTSRAAAAAATAAALAADRMADRLKDEAEALRALGMAGAGLARWQAARTTALARQIDQAAVTSAFSTASRSFRLFLQSAMLGLGAWLVLRGELSAGVMVAASVMMGRGLAPVETAIGQWPLVQRAREGRDRLAALLSLAPPAAARTPLPRPAARIVAQNLTVAAPGEGVALLRGLSFRVEPGQAIGVIGPSGSGKSTLARVLTGAWPPAAGTLRLDGATLDQFGAEALGALVGYLPQRVGLFDGTIAENIARLAPRPDAARVVAAAERAGAHGMILRLPLGYDTPVSAFGGRLSGGQIQRIGLARALYGSPAVVVLDEPNANLDNDGSMALNQAIRALKAEGCAVFIMAHRPAAIQECDLLLVLEEGMRTAFGPRDQVLRDMVRNHGEILRSAGPGGVS